MTQSPKEVRGEGQVPQVEPKPTPIPQGFDSNGQPSPPR